MAATSIGNVTSTPHTSTADLRVGTAVALASSVAKYWVLTNLFPGPLQPVSVYHHPHHNSSATRNGAQPGTATPEPSAKEGSAALTQEMALATASHHQHQATVSTSVSHHGSLPSNAQVCHSVSMPDQTVES